MTIGIYALKWELPDLWYIGQSSRIEERFKDHVREMNNKVHCNFKLIDTYHKYGMPELAILEQCKLLELNDREFYYIQEFDSYNNGLNLSIGAQEFCVGEHHPNSIYSNECIEKAFLLLVDRKLPHKIIAEQCNVTLDSIKAISCGKNHGWLQEIYPEKYLQLLSSIKKEHNSGEKHSCSKHSNETISKAFLEYLVPRTRTLKEIAILTKIHHSTLSNIVAGLQHKWLEQRYPEEYKIMRSKTTKRK